MTRIVPDEKDWTVVLKEGCAECGHDMRSTTPEDIVQQLPHQVQRLLAVLDRDQARERVDPARWSDQEYVVHVAQMLDVMVARFGLMLNQDEPTFENWDQDLAAERGHYNELSASQAANALREAASRFADRLEGISPHDYHRTGLRSNGAAFTITSLAQYAWHDLLHHLWDVKG